MTTHTFRFPDVEPGEAVPFAVSVTGPNGALVDLTGATVEATVTAGSGFSEAVALAPEEGNVNRWAGVIGAGITTALIGRQGKLRVWVTPAAALETTVAVGLFNVAP